MTGQMKSSNPKPEATPSAANSSLHWSIRPASPSRPLDRLHASCDEKDSKPLSHFLACSLASKTIAVMTHAQLVLMAVNWLRRYQCGIVLAEQVCVSGEMPDAIGWKRASHSVLVECKISRPDFLADRGKPFRQKAELGLGCERFYLVPAGLLCLEELPAGWGLLEVRGRQIEIIRPSSKKMRTSTGLHYEMNLLLASLRRVEIRIEPQTITHFLKWKNRMAEYNRGSLPEGISAQEEEPNFFLEPESAPHLH